MKLVGFGCSFTYGSELVNPDLDFQDADFHHMNTRYRQRHCWLGCLANKLGATFDNRAEPANSNYAIQYQFADWFNNNRNPSERVVVCVAWTDIARFSWLDESWVHNGNARKFGQKFLHSRKDWITSNVDHQYWTDAAKLFVNSVCKLHNIPIIQFNSIGAHTTTNYAGYFVDGSTMEDILKQAQSEDDREQLFANGGHPSEAGHVWFTKRLTEFAKEHILL